MSNKTTTSILEYAEVHRDFSMDDLFAYLHEKVGISKSSLSWYLFKLVNENALVRTGRGMYAKVMKQSFVPKLIGEVREIYDSLLVNFPFAKFCVYQGDIIAPLQHHLSSNRVVYVETDRDSAETVFNFLKDGNRDVYLRPDKDMIYRYGQPCLFCEKFGLGSSFAESIRCTDAYTGKAVGGYIEGCGFLLPTR